MELELSALHALTTPSERREAIVGLEGAMIEAGSLPPESCPVLHHFAPGSYAREMLLPKGIRVVGKIHKHAHINVISAGCVVVFTENEGVLTLRAPYTFVSTPGTKRAVFAIEDTVWTTVHVTDKTCLAEIEAEVIATDFKEPL